jgi:hypothetical protein
MGAPPLCGGGPPCELGLLASVPPAAMACGRGQVALRSAHSPVLPGAWQKYFSQ